MQGRAESPSHGFAVPAPFRQRGRRDGGRIATASVRTGLAMTGFFTWGAVQGRAGRSGGRPLRRGTRGAVGRADVGIGPYEWVIDGAVCGGTHGCRPTRRYFVGGGQRRPPLRRGTRNAARRGVCVEENSEKRKSKKPIAFAIGFLVGDGGFEPPKASPADLQSVPFGHSGNPPYYL